MKTINLPPFAPNLMESTRAMGYSLESAIADIIDNSITAKCKNVWIDYDCMNEKYICVLDDGYGMDEDELINAMRYGSTSSINRDSDDLGRFGLGLKTASLSQCRELTVLSKKNNNIVGCRWDLNLIQKTGEWSLILLDDSELRNSKLYDQLDQLSNGTLVIWSDLDRLGEELPGFETHFLNSMTLVSNHLRLVFHRYLDGEIGICKIAISMNGNKLSAFDPFLSSKSNMVMDKEIIKIENCKVEITPYVLPHISKLTNKEKSLSGGKDDLKENQGFYIYRNKRLISWGTWFRLIRKGELSKLARVKVDIPNSLDQEWTLDVKKSVVRPPEVVRQNLIRIISRIEDASVKTFKHKGTKEIDDKNYRIWNRSVNDEHISYMINKDNVYISGVLNSLDGFSGKKVNSLFALVEKNIPLNMIKFDMNKDKAKINKDFALSGEVQEYIQFFVENAKLNNIELNDLLEKLERVEPFSSNWKVTKQSLVKEYTKC